MKQLDPKSIIFIPDLAISFNRMFSGLRSQWIILHSDKYNSAYNIWIANLLTKSSSNP